MNNSEISFIQIIYLLQTVIKASMNRAHDYANRLTCVLLNSPPNIIIMRKVLRRHQLNDTMKQFSRKKIAYR